MSKKMCFGSIAALCFTLVLFTVAQAEQQKDELMRLTPTQAVELGLYDEMRSFFYPYCTKTLALVMADPNDLISEITYENMRTTCEDIYTNLQSVLARQGINVSLAELQNPEVAQQLVELSETGFAQARNEKNEQFNNEMLKAREQHNANMRK